MSALPDRWRALSADEVPQEAIPEALGYTTDGSRTGERR